MANGTAAVVGVGPGLGLAIATRFGREGYRVALVARRAEALDEYAERLRSEGIEARGFPADAADHDALAGAFDAIRGALGDPDVLVYNAALIATGRPTEVGREELLASFSINVAGALSAAQQVAPQMRSRGAGTILFTGGSAAHDPYVDYAALSVGKAGLRNLCINLAKELEPDGIHVAMVTVHGGIRAGTRFDPELIAERYWWLHRQERGSWDRETVYE